MDALTLVTRLHLLALCRLAVQRAQRRCPPPVPADPGGRPRRYTEESLLLVALLRTLWRLSYQDLHDWLVDWPALAQACGLPCDAQGRVQVPSPAQQCKRAHHTGAPPFETLFVLLVHLAQQTRLIGGRDVIVDSAPLLAWRRSDPDAALGHAPAHHARPLLCGYRVHTLLCRGSGLPLLFLLSPCSPPPTPTTRPLPVRSWRRRCASTTCAHAWFVWTRATGAYASSRGSTPRSARSPSSPGTPSGRRIERVSRRPGPPTNWANAPALSASLAASFRSSAPFRLQRPPLVGWTAVETRVALTYAATLVVGLAAHEADRPDLIRSPTRVLAHVWEGMLE